MIITFVNMVDPYSIMNSQTPLGLVSLFSIAKRNNISADICDLNYLYYKNKIKRHRKFKKNIEEMAKKILRKGTKIVSIYSMCNTYYMALLVGKIIKQLVPTTILVLAGPHATLVAKETLADFPFVDYIAMGEGELTLINNVRGMIKKENSLFDGLAYRDNNNNIIVKWDRHKRIDINELDLIDVWEFNDPKDFDYVVSIEGGRGCPFHCSFCSTQKFWGNIFQIKSIKNIMEEILYYYNKYQITDFSIQHDLFTFNREYVIQFCQTLNKYKIENINWACSSRIDVIDNEMLRIMSESGCSNIFFGIESGSSKIQKYIHKNLDLEKVVNVVNEMIKLKMSGTFSFIYDFPIETEEDINATIGLIHKIKQISLMDTSVNMNINLASLCYLPGTEISDIFYEQLVYNRIGGMVYYKEKGIEPSIEKLLQEHKSIFLHCYNLKQNISFEKKCFGYFYAAFFDKIYIKNYNEMDILFKKYKNNYVKLYKEIYSRAENEVVAFCDYAYCTYKVNTKIIKRKFDKIIKRYLSYEE